MKRNAILINGKQAIIEYRKSRSKQKNNPKLYTLKVYKILEELLKGDRKTQPKKGLNTLKTFTNLDGANLWGDTRPSNAIVELRKVIPKNGLLTFRYLDEKNWRYGLIKDKEIIKFADDLLSKIRDKLSLKL